MKVAIYSRGLDFEQENPIQLLLEELMRHETSILIFHQLLEQFSFPPQMQEKLKPFYNSADLSNDIDILISLGGDGTMLDAVTLVKQKNIPILGINFGRLGFLASISRNELSLAVDALINRTLVIYLLL
jgi:NAD+ kinase